VQAQILDLLADKQRERDMAMVLVTHDLGVVAGRTDETIVMYAGRVVEQAPTTDLFEGMRMPYTEALMQSIPRMDEPSHTPLLAIEGMPPDLTRPTRGCAFAPRCPYVRDRCREEAPPLRTDATVGSGHQFACWFPVGVEGARPSGRRKASVAALAPRKPAASGSAAGATRKAKA
ncbi:MAG: oligopeptide/dipeptide ABC transporter ATP-binding protein, partial [Gaiellaceae bacterium]